MKGGDLKCGIDIVAGVMAGVAVVIGSIRAGVGVRLVLGVCV